MRQVLVSRPALAQLDELPSKERRRVVRGLEALGEDPFTPRSGCDIKKLEVGTPPKYRLRVGEWRAVYVVEPAEVRAISIFRRGQGYRIE
jgi:mRNA interferase RelE/StbE